MAENDCLPGGGGTEVEWKDAVCADIQRVYDSCSDKDCIEDIRVLFPPDRQPLVDSAASARVRDVNVITVYIDLQPIPFHRGFFSVDMTFFFDVCVDLFAGGAAGPTAVNGVAVFNKKVVLFGSEGSAQTFSSGVSPEAAPPEGDRSLPRATVQVARPVALSARLCGSPPCGCEPSCRVPEAIAQRYGGSLDAAPQQNAVYVTIGLFTMVRMVRRVQLLLPAYDFCLPEKECPTSTDNPCELFRSIDFPTEEFFPPKAASPTGCQ